MDACDEYVRLCVGLAGPISLGQIRRYMLRRFGLSFNSTSEILHDLAEIGRVKVIDRRITFASPEMDTL